MTSDQPRDPQGSPWTHRGRIRADYRDALHDLDEQLVALADAVVELAAPVARVDLAMAPDAVEVAGRRFDQLQQLAVALEDRAFTLVALESPVAEDLREVVALIRAVHDVVRSGRLAGHVIRQLSILEACGVATRTDELGAMRVASTTLFGQAVDAWRNRDALAYNDLAQRDSRVDAHRDALLAASPDCHEPQCLAAHVLAVRFLERYADHGVALCGHLSWAITGDRVLGQRVDSG